MKRRHLMMTGAAAVLATALPAFGQEQEEGMVLRRPQRPGEDPIFYRFGQRGRLLPRGSAVVVRYEGLRIVVHHPRYTYQGPLIVFSHGALADPQIYRQIFDHWVSHGFVVAAPVHDDSIFERGLLARRTGATGTAEWDYDSVLNNPTAWNERVSACMLPLDTTTRLSDTIGMGIDTSKPVIVGHEFGAFVAQLLMGAKVVVEGSDAINYADPRWFASLLLSPQGAGVMGLVKSSWSEVSRPMMVVQGALDSDFTWQDPQRKIDAFWKSPAGNKHLAWFPTGGRLLFAGSRSTDARSEEDFENVKAITTAFLQAYANYDADVFSLLASDWADRATLGRVQTRYR